jgi:hypothetical protein
MEKTIKLFIMLNVFSVIALFNVNASVTYTTLIYGEANILEDTFVLSDLPDTNYGASNQLKVGSDLTDWANWTSYLKWDISTWVVNESLTRADMCIWYQSSSANNVNVFGVSNNTWIEEQLTYNTRPSYNSTVMNYTELPAYSASDFWRCFNVVDQLHLEEDGNMTIMMKYVDGFTSCRAYGSSKEFSPASGRPTITLYYEHTNPSVSFTINFTNIDFGGVSMNTENNPADNNYSIEIAGEDGCSPRLTFDPLNPELWVTGKGNETFVINDTFYGGDFTLYAEPVVMEIDGVLTMLVSDSQPTTSLQGYKWNGSQWVSNETVIQGIPLTPSYHIYFTSLDFDGNLNIIYADTFHQETLKALTWNGSHWVANTTLETDLNDAPQTGSGLVHKRTELYRWGNETRVFYGYNDFGTSETPCICIKEWNVTQWDIIKTYCHYSGLGDDNLALNFTDNVSSMYCANMIPSYVFAEGKNWLILSAEQWCVNYYRHFYYWNGTEWQDDSSNELWENVNSEGNLWWTFDNLTYGDKSWLMGSGDDKSGKVRSWGYEHEIVNYTLPNNKVKMNYTSNDTYVNTTLHELTVNKSFLIDENGVAEIYPKYFLDVPNWQFAGSYIGKQTIVASC